MKLSSRDVKRKDELALRLRAAEEALREAMCVVDEAVQSIARDKLVGPIETYNAACQEVEDFVGEVAGDLRDQVDEKSDRWRDSDAGQAADSMASEWENYEAPELLVVPELLPVEVNGFDEDKADALDGLPTESDQ